MFFINIIYHLNNSETVVKMKAWFSKIQIIKAKIKIIKLKIKIHFINTHSRISKMIKNSNMNNNRIKIKRNGT